MFPLIEHPRSANYAMKLAQARQTASLPFIKNDIDSHYYLCYKYC